MQSFCNALFVHYDFSFISKKGFCLFCVSSRFSGMFHNAIFLPHELYHGPIQWAPSTPLRGEIPKSWQVFSPLSGSSGGSPRSSSDSSEEIPESFVANFPPSEPLCDVLEAFRLFWDRELHLLDSGSHFPLDEILVNSVVVQEDDTANQSCQ